MKHEQLIDQVESMFLQNAESLVYEDVIQLSNSINHQREKYPKEVLAKTYLLLTSIALNKGEIDTALQFTQDGLALVNNHQKVWLFLQLKLAEILTEKKDYQALLMVAEQLNNTPLAKEDTKYLLIALSYRSVAFAMLSEHEKALQDLKEVQSVIELNPAFNEHISLLSILANAYYHLGEFQTALKIQLNILKLRYNLNRLNNVGRSYFHLGNAYFHLGRYNDAYNAYWEAKEYALKDDAPIYAAYARQGLALTLLHQQQYEEAKRELLAAQKTFQLHNLAAPYLETLISLAKIGNETQQFSASYKYLIEAESIAGGVRLDSDYIVFYQLLAQMYLANNKLVDAYYWQQQYSQALLQHQVVNVHQTSQDLQPGQKTNASAQTRELAEKLAHQSELTSTYASKYQYQQIIISILIVLLIIILSCQFFIWYSRRSKRLRTVYDQQSPSNHVIANSVQTKQLYQTSFKMARKYAYPLTLGYIAIDNWQEINFKFNSSTIEEVKLGIAKVINEHISEFENAGVINEGEYLIIYPHQTKAEASKAMENLLQALKVRFFANLGEFSVTLSYSVEGPNIQDIDPYVFLSQLSTSVKSI